MTAPQPATPPDARAFAAVLEAAPDGIVVVDAGRRYLYVNPAAGRLLGSACADLIGQDFLLNFPPSQHPVLIAQFAAGLAGRPGQWTTLIRRPDGAEREISYTNMAVTVRGQRCGGAILRDLSAANRRTAREREALISIASTVAVAGALDTTLDALAALVVRATDAIACEMALVDGEPPRLRVAGSFGLPAGYSGALDAAIGAGAPAPSVQAIRERRPVVVHDAPRHVLADPRFGPIQDFAREETWDTIISVPLIYRPRDLGVMNTYYAQQSAAGEAAIPFLTAIADQAALAIENSSLLLEAQDQAALEERQRLARELHDSVAQALAGIVQSAGTARRVLAQDPARAAAPLAAVLSLAEAGLAEMRALIFELRPESLANEGLVAALSKQIAALRARYPLAIAATFCPEPDLPLSAKETLYRIAQEALQNVVRHARATQVQVDLACPPRRLILTIHDDGAGFDPAAPAPGHLGLRALRERVARLGGTVQLTSAPGAGTRLLVEIPVRNAQS